MHEKRSAFSFQPSLRGFLSAPTDADTSALPHRGLGHLYWRSSQTAPAPQPCTRHLWQQLRDAKELWGPPPTHLLIGLGAAFKLLPWPFFLVFCLLGMCLPHLPCCSSLLHLNWAFWFDFLAWPQTCLVATGFFSSHWAVAGSSYCCGTCLAFLNCLKAVLFPSEPIWPSSSVPCLSSVEEYLNSGCSLPPSQKVSVSNVYKQSLQSLLNQWGDHQAEKILGNH